MILRSFGLVVALGIASFIVVGCSTGAEDTESGDGALTPCSAPGATGATCPSTLDDQRNLCKQREAENGAFRNQDLATGVVRWKCGDVTGVTKTDLGQEYCEFHALQAGKIVDTAGHGSVKPGDVECLFTGVYGDVKGEPGSQENIDYGTKLNKALTDEAGNLKNAQGAQLAMALAVQADTGKVAPGPNPLSVMNGQFNSRGAATKLISDCHDAANKPANTQRVNAADDSVKCAADGSGCESARDVEACTLVTDAGVGWRNSDPIICGRAGRGALCGASYVPLPDKLDGFIMTDWKGDLAQAVKLWTGQSTTPPSAPDGCRYATVDGKPYLHMMICTPTAASVNDPKYDGRLQQMCSDVFGPRIAMTAPIGLVTKAGKDQPGFCTDFDKGVQTITSVATGK